MRRVAFLALLIGVVSAGLLAGTASSAQRRCNVQLRVNVFNPSGPGSHWGLHGALNAGRLATLRAVARGCELDHITGRWRSGASGAFPGSPDMCSGRICQWGVRSNFMSAADFQAYAKTLSGGTERSNIVRVGWAGSDVVGTWRWFYASPGSPLQEHGTVTFNSDHTMTWDQGGSGTWSQAQNDVELVWTHKNPVTRDTMKLEPDGRTMVGQNDDTPPWPVKGVKQ